ncbi:MAG: 50S ribosomal protein L9 [Chlamydiales bacterium]
MDMELLLLEDVDSLGKKGNVVKVKPGYARNFLLPKHYAVVADKRTLKLQARLQAEREKRAAEDLKEAQELAQKLAGAVFTVETKVDPEGHLYGSVSAQDIRELIEKKHSVELEKRAVVLKHAIKKLGVYTIELKLKEGVVSSVDLQVIAEETAE